MTKNNINPYAPPNPLDPGKQFAPKEAGDRRDRPKVGVGAVLWWCYFAICCWVFYSHATKLIAFVHTYSISWVLKPIGFQVQLEMLGLVGLLCYLRKVPLLHPFFWGLLFFAELGFTAYYLIIFAKSVAGLEGGFESIVWTRQLILLVAFLFSPLPRCYALWRYSSPSSPIWSRPRIQWRQLAQRLGEIIANMRRA